MNNKRIVFLDYIRVAAAVSVIFIHVLNSGLLYYSSPHMGQGIVLFSEIWKNCLFWGVPCFLMITGYLLLPPEKDLTYKTIFRAYIPRMIGVLIVFGIPFTWMELIFEEHRIYPAQLLRAAVNVATGNTWAHLWYVYAMIGIYVMLPCLRLLVRETDEIDQKYLFTLLFIIVCVSPILKEFSYDLHSIFKLILSSHHYPLWLFIGYLFRLEQFHPYESKAAYALFFSTALIAVLTAISLRYHLFKLSFLFSYSSALVLIQSSAIFSLLKRYADIVGHEPGVIRVISDNSFGIYIVHMFYLNLFYKVLKIDPFAFGYGSILIILALGLAILSLSLLTVMLIKKLPGFRKIL